MDEVDGVDEAEVNRLVAAAASGGIREGLAAVRLLRRLVEEMEAQQVDRARALGWAWGDIAEPLGVSRQSAHKKHARRRRPAA